MTRSAWGDNTIAVKGKYIAVEGPIGVGKSQLISALAERLSAQTIKDTDNPFLPSFYNNMGKYAFQVQLFFLMSRFQQQVDCSQPDLFSQYTLCDYLFHKDRLFASLTLEPQEFALYEKVYGLLKGTAATPDIVIYLQASTDTLIKRIAEKDEDLALLLPKAYLEKVVHAFQTFFFHFSLCPVIVCNTDKNDFENNPDNIDLLIRKISEVKSGLNYLNLE